MNEIDIKFTHLDAVNLSLKMLLHQVRELKTTLKSLVQEENNEELRCTRSARSLLHLLRP